MIHDLVFLVDVDNTLLDNDQIKIAIKQSLTRVLGPAEADHFWQHHDAFRAYAKLVDFPAITRTYCTERNAETCETTVGDIFEHINFASALYPNALAVLRHIKTLGRVFVFSEGDMVYQKQKIEKSGIAAAADGVFLFEHKLEHLHEIAHTFANATMVVIDDRDDKLLEIKHALPTAVTVVVCQGHYATPDCSMNHTADLVVGSVDELLQFSRDAFLTSVRKSPAPR